MSSPRSFLAPLFVVAAPLAIAACNDASPGGPAGAQGGGDSTSRSSSSDASSSHTAGSTGGHATTGTGGATTGSGGLGAGAGGATTGAGGDPTGGGGDTTTSGAGAGGFGAGGAQPGTEWGKVFSGSSFQFASAVAVDAHDDVTVGGYTQDWTDFGCGSVIVSSGANTAYVAKLDATGACLWARTFGAGAAEVDDLGVDAEGRIFAGGIFQGGLDVGLGHSMSADDTDGYVIVFAPDGTPLAQRDVGPTFELHMAVNDAGKAAVAFAFQGDIDPGGGVLHDSGTVGTDLALVEYDAALEVVFQHAYGDADTDGTAGEFAGAVAVAPDGGVALTGTFCGDMDFGGGVTLQADAAVCPQGSFGVPFVALFDSAGEGVAASVWEAMTGAPRVAFAPTGEAVLHGAYTGTIDFGVATLGPVANASTGFVAVLAADGHPTFARGVSSTKRWQPTAVATDANGAVVITGTFGGTANVGAADMGGQGTFTYYAIFDPTLAPLSQSAFRVPSAQQQIRAVALDPTGHLVVAGNFGATIDFGGVTVQTTAGIEVDAFVARILP